MQLAYDNLKKFKSQCESKYDIIRMEQLDNQINRLSNFLNDNSSSLVAQQVKEIQNLIKIYIHSKKQMKKLKLQFASLEVMKQCLLKIFNNKKQQNSLQEVREKSSEIKSSEIQIQSFAKQKHKQNSSNILNNQREQMLSNLKSFFDKKQTQIHKKNKSNFKQILNSQKDKSLNKSINKQSGSKDQSSHVSRSSVSSNFKKSSKNLQLKKILEQNKKIKQEYEKKLNLETELNDFEKGLLRDQKNRYMLKIQQLQKQLQNLYRDNYKLKEEIQIKSKTVKDNDLNQIFSNFDEKINQKKDYYQPYVMKTKSNDLKKLNIKCQSQIDAYQTHSKTDQNYFNTHQFNELLKPIHPQEPVIDVLGHQLQKELYQIQKSKNKINQSPIQYKKSNQSRYSQKKNIKNFNIQTPDDFLKVLRDDDQQQQEEIQNQRTDFNKALIRHDQPNSKIKSQNNSFPNESEKKMAKIQQGQFKDQREYKINVVPSYQNVYQAVNSKFKQIEPIEKNNQSLKYNYQPNYSFTQTVGKDYSITSTNSKGYETFQLTKTYMNFSQNQQSQTNKYIDSRTSTRNKVAFFKDSLILIKNQTFQLAFKRSSMVSTKDRVRIIFFIKNKTQQSIAVNLRYEYDSTYFKLKINQKLQNVAPNSQSKEDLEVFAFSKVDLNEVIDIMLRVNLNQYGLWMPLLWIELQYNDNFKLPDKNELISIIPDRQFKNYQTAKTIIPLMFGGKDAKTHWAYLYGICKFGGCFVKLTWQETELRIQTDAKWIDLLAFIMHHVK